MSARRDTWVDAAKGIGILLVVYGHIARGVDGAGMSFGGEGYALADSVIYTFHMPLFLFLSGLFFQRSLQKRGGAELIASKADTILYPYVLWSLLQGGIELLFARYTNDVITAHEVFNLLEPRAQFWFLYALFLLMVLGTLLYARLHPRFYGGVTLAAALVFVMQNALPDVLNADYLYYSLVYFVAGVWFNDRKQLFLPYSRRLALPVLLLAMAGQWLFHGYFELTYENIGPGLLALAGISILAVVLLTHALNDLWPRWLLLLGASSMAIYLMHILAGSGIRVILQKLLGVDDPVVHLVLGVSLALLMPLLALRVMQRKRWMFFIEAPRPVSGQYWYQRKFQT